MPPDIIIAAFDMLRPAGRWPAQVRLWDNLWNDKYVKSYRMMERWTAETLPLAGELLPADGQGTAAQERASSKTR